LLVLVGTHTHTTPTARVCACVRVRCSHCVRSCVVCVVPLRVRVRVQRSLCARWRSDRRGTSPRRPSRVSPTSSSPPTGRASSTTPRYARIASRRACRVVPLLTALTARAHTTHAM
jgi:hypothetical protein